MDPNSDFSPVALDTAQGIPEQCGRMGSSGRSSKRRKGSKIRVAFRRNRSRPARKKNWTEQVRDAGASELDTVGRELIAAKGELSRHRTIKVASEEDPADENLRAGVVLAMRGLYAEVDDGVCVRRCTIRRVLRTRLIDDRHPVAVGDRVRFRIDSKLGGVAQEGVIESVEPRRSQLRRRVGRRIHTIGANVDNAIIVTSAGEPAPKPHLIDRYIVASLSGELSPVICMNKIDLDASGSSAALLERYERLGYTTLRTSAVTGVGMDDLRGVLKDRVSLLTGQSGVGKSSLLNAVQPTLALRVADVSVHTSKGRHTTSTARLIRLDIGGYVVDTPGIRTLDLSIVPRNEFEEHFVEFREHVTHCKFPDCTHTHEAACAVKAAVERGDIHPGRYESYVRLFTDQPD